MQEAGEAILVKARGRIQAATDAEVALKMAEEYDYEDEKAKAQEEADAAIIIKWDEPCKPARQTK